MNKNEFVEKISHLLSDDDERNSRLLEFVEATIKKIPHCNKCGRIFETYRGDLVHETTKVAVHWGYNSTGKDMDHDQWALCRTCTKKFKKAYEPICSICTKSIVEVMAGLYARNPGCTFFGDYAGALKHYRTENHCGLEFAKVGSRIVCEGCYEAFISDFKVPLPREEYDPFTGDPEAKEGFQRKNRIKEAFNYRLTESHHSFYYETRLSYEETVSIRNTTNKDERFISLSYTKDKPEWTKKLEFYKAKNPDDPSWIKTVNAQTGDNRYAKIPISWLEEQAKTKNVSFDPTQLKIDCQGLRLSFGELQLSSSEILQWIKN